MTITTTASALPAKGSWGSFAHRLLEGIAAVRDNCQERRMMPTGGPGHPGLLSGAETAVRRRDADRLRGHFEGFSVMIPE